MKVELVILIKFPFLSILRGKDRPLGPVWIGHRKSWLGRADSPGRQPNTSLDSAHCQLESGKFSYSPSQATRGCKSANVQPISITRKAQPTQQEESRRRGHDFSLEP